MKPDFTILAVCSGNVCRSPLIELLLRERMGVPGFAFTSAGVIAQPGWRMPPEAQATAVRLGVPSEVAAAHVAHRVNEADVSAADLVLTATKEHRAAVIELVPKAIRRTFTIRQFARLIEAFDETTCRSGTAHELVDRAHHVRSLLPRPFCPEVDDLEDPIGQPQEAHDRIGDQIADAVATVVRQLRDTKPLLDEMEPEHAQDMARPPLDLTFPRPGTPPRQPSWPDAPTID